MWTHLLSPLADKLFVNMDFSLHPLADSPPQFGRILAASPIARFSNDSTAPATHLLSVEEGGLDLDESAG